MCLHPSQHMRLMSACLACKERWPLGHLGTTTQSHVMENCVQLQMCKQMCTLRTVGRSQRCTSLLPKPAPACGCTHARSVPLQQRRARHSSTLHGAPTAPCSTGNRSSSCTSCKARINRIACMPSPLCRNTCHFVTNLQPHSALLYTQPSPLLLFSTYTLQGLGHGQ
jgi:hypothetical protein